MAKGSLKKTFMFIWIRDQLLHRAYSQRQGNRSGKSLTIAKPGHLIH
jgi:hypothetical protein